MDDYSPSLSSPSLTIPPTNAYNVESSTVENGNCSESIDSVLDKVTNGKRVILADDRQPEEENVANDKGIILADDEQPEKEVLLQKTNSRNASMFLEAGQNLTRCYKKSGVTVTIDPPWKCILGTGHPHLKMGPFVGAGEWVTRP